MYQEEILKAIKEQTSAIKRQISVMEQLNHNIEKLFSQGYLVDIPKEDKTTRALEFAQYKHNMANAATDADMKRIQTAYNNMRKKEYER